MTEAKCYAVYGRHKYYRTKDGETFCITNGKHYFYHGNVNKEKQEAEYLVGRRLDEIKKMFSFVD